MNALILDKPQSQEDGSIQSLLSDWKQVSELHQAPFHISTDTKRLCGRLSALEAKRMDKLMEVCKMAGMEDKKIGQNYHYSIHDKANGIRIFHRPKIPCYNYTTMIQFHGYSENGRLLQAVFDTVPLHEWFAKQIDISFDSTKSMKDIHAVHPKKRAKIRNFKGTFYMGGKTSKVSLMMYDKQKQMKKRGIPSPTWTRVELRFRFKPMKQLKELNIADFIKAMDYNVLLDTSDLEPKMKNYMDKLHRGEIQFKDVPRRMADKIKKHGAEQGLNLYDLILEAGITDIQSFIYQPKRNNQFHKALQLAQNLSS